MVRAFPKGISPKVNVKAGLSFELAYFKDVVQHFSYYDLAMSEIDPPVGLTVKKKSLRTRLVTFLRTAWNPL